MRLIYLSVPVLLLLHACADPSHRNIKAYYFPIDDLKQGMVYQYESTQNGTSQPEYWYYKTLVRDSGLYLAATNYDHQFAIVQIRSENIVKSGAIAKDYFLYEPDTLHRKMVQVKAQITAADLFPFSVTDSLGVFLFKLNYHPANDSNSTNYVIRNRRYLGDAPDFELEGKKYPCMRMGIREVVGNEREGSWEAEGEGEEWYAKGLGLVYYKKTFNKGQLVLESKLKTRFPMSELEKRAKQ